MNLSTSNCMDQLQCTAAFMHTTTCFPSMWRRYKLSPDPLRLWPQPSCAAGVKKQQPITTNLIHNKSVLGLGQYYTGWMVVTIIIIIFLFLLGGSGLLGQLCGWWGCVTTGGGRVGWGRLHGHNLTHLSTQTPVIVLDIFQTVVMSLWWRKLFTHHAQDRQAQDEVNKIMLGNFISSLAFSAWS